MFRALHLAAKDGMVAATESLLSKGASVFAVDSRGRYPALSCAANEKIADCLELIISQMIQVGGPTPRPSLTNTRTSVDSIGNNIGLLLIHYPKVLGKLLPALQLKHISDWCLSFSEYMAFS